MNVGYSDFLGAYRSLALPAKVHIDCQKSDPGRRSERPGAHVSSGTGVGGRTRLRRPGAAENASSEEVFNGFPSCSFVISIWNDQLGFVRGRSIYPSRAVIILLLARRRTMPVFVPACAGSPLLVHLSKCRFLLLDSPFQCVCTFAVCVCADVSLSTAGPLGETAPASSLLAASASLA